MAADKSLVALPGASPGASTAAWIILRAIERCFDGELDAAGWKTELQDVIPSHGKSLIATLSWATGYAPRPQRCCICRMSERAASTSVPSLGVLSR